MTREVQISFFLYNQKDRIHILMVNGCVGVIMIMMEENWLLSDVYLSKMHFHQANNWTVYWSGILHMWVGFSLEITISGKKGNSCECSSIAKHYINRNVYQKVSKKWWYICQNSNSILQKHDRLPCVPVYHSTASS